MTLLHFCHSCVVLCVYVRFPGGQVEACGVQGVQDAGEQGRLESVRRQDALVSVVRLGGQCCLLIPAPTHSPYPPMRLVVFTAVRPFLHLRIL